MVRSVLVTVVLSGAAVTTAQAQRAHERSGVWAAAGLGIGSARASCSVCAGRASGPAAHARLGGTISRKLLVGVQGIGWFANAAASDRWLLMLATVGTLYPWPNQGFYLEAGIGGYRYVESDTANELSTQGLALHVGVGFDLRITRGMSLSPFALLVSSGSGNPTRLDKSSGARLPLLSDMTMRYFQLGVGATLH